MLRVRRFTVITPCRNAADRVGATVQSVVEQTAVRSERVTLQYLVQDGASTDGTIAAVRAAGGERAQIASEPDGGMYDALAKGLRQADGDVVAYLNAGDVYHPAAFDVVADVLESTDVRWLTGLRVACNERLQVTDAVLPFPYRRDLVRKGYYGRVLPFIQQESTFWRRELMGTVDVDRLSALRHAGDFYLWRCFAERAELAIVEAHLGSFTYHRGQLSEDRAAYMRELETLREASGPLDWLRARVDQKLWALPATWKKRMRPKLILRYDHAEGRWV